MSRLCNVCKSNRFHCFYVQTLPNKCSHIEDVHLLFCKQLINIYLFLRGVVLRHFSPSERLKGCLNPVICNSNTFHFLIFKLCIRCAPLFELCTFENISLYFQDC